MKHFLVFTATLTLLITACRTQKATTEVVKPAEKTLSDQAQIGEKLYLENCGRCHDLPKIPDHSAERWERIVPSMAKKSRLDANQEQAVMTYVREMLN